MTNHQTPRVTIIIPHFNGEEILRDCLTSIRQTANLPVTVFLVDNGSTDNSIAMVRQDFPETVILSQEKNRGFAGGCNAGIRAARTEYVLILNNDTVHDPLWVQILVNYLDENPETAVVQPKLLSWQNRELFDYSGAAGGEMDIFGFPFARGRMFAGESMVSRVSGAGKAAFVALAEYLYRNDVPLLDCQVHTTLLETFGAYEVPRDEYLRELSPLIAQPELPGDWSGESADQYIDSAISRISSGNRCPR